MHTVIEEEDLCFDFDESWNVVKYDKHPDYIDHIQKLAGTKAVDFVAILNREVCYLIEAKDFRGDRIKNKYRISDGDLAVEVSQKVRDTIAGIMAAHHRGKTEPWAQFVSCLTQTEPPVRVVHWLEDHLPPGPPGRRKNQASVMNDSLKTKLRWLTTKVFVTSLAQEPLPGLTVTNLPGAGQNR